jgi:K+-transporting ATPase ATPase A chain
VIGVIVITGGVIYFPAVALGPVVEHYSLLAGSLYSSGS